MSTERQLQLAQERKTRQIADRFNAIFPGANGIPGLSEVANWARLPGLKQAIATRHQERTARKETHKIAVKELGAAYLDATMPETINQLYETKIGDHNSPSGPFFGSYRVETILPPEDITQTIVDLAISGGTISKKEGQKIETEVKRYLEETRGGLTFTIPTFTLGNLFNVTILSGSEGAKKQNSVYLRPLEPGSREVILTDLVAFVNSTQTVSPVVEKYFNEGRDVREGILKRVSKPQVLKVDGRSIVPAVEKSGQYTRTKDANFLTNYDIGQSRIARKGVFIFKNKIDDRFVTVITVKDKKIVVSQCISKEAREEYRAKYNIRAIAQGRVKKAIAGGEKQDLSPVSLIREAYRSLGYTEKDLVLKTNSKLDSLGPFVLQILLVEQDLPLPIHSIVHSLWYSSERSDQKATREQSGLTWETNLKSGDLARLSVKVGKE